MLDPSALIRESILCTLPSIAPESLQNVIEKLMQQGVDSREDLQYVREQDMEEFIRPIQCRKLLEAWKPKEPENSCDLRRQMSACSPLMETSSLSSSPMSSPPMSPPHLRVGNWPDTFEIKWDTMPLALRTAIQNGKRPLPGDRRQFIRILVDDMRKFEVNPSRAQCLLIAKAIVRQYPQSFADTMDDGRTTIGAGYESILSQMKVRVEHLNRNNTLARRRKSKAVTAETPQRQPADSYGCIRWNPELPPEETSEALEEMRQRMTEIFSQEGLSGVERAEVINFMETTYYLQRQMINAIPGPAFEDLKQQWPYLFVPRCMCSHFELLTDVPIVRKIEAFVEEHGKILTEFFKQNTNNEDVKAVLYRAGCSVTAPNIIQLVMAHFKEPLDALIIEADVSSTPAMIQTVSLPESPRLIVLGPTLLTDQRGCVSVEGQVVSEGGSFVLGLAVLLSTYYNFNLQYQDQAACSLEFIQRICMGINPERGSKAHSGPTPSRKTGKMVQKKPSTVNPHVCTLIRKLNDFKWDFV
ncbi:uncharacterized protein LOC116680827 [Etheostoma spectabile]|uniref:uncharacterized protein LOC116680827 n=1 Tax=Etheostoma spectabile TaxID=54343 RepID=UPI0013AFD030|nr:uncharacterized protein LOC116680827 [Etheostoma spectabile]